MFLKALRYVNEISKDEKLSDLSHQLVEKLINPLLRLRQACVHPQVAKGQTLSLQKWYAKKTFTDLRKFTLRKNHFQIQ